jgi:hypothetical protein
MPRSVSSLVSPDQLNDAQARLIASLKGKRGILGVGIASGARKGELAFEVYVASAKLAASLPTQFENVPVVAQVVGRVRAF